MFALALLRGASKLRPSILPTTFTASSQPISSSLQPLGLYIPPLRKLLHFNSGTILCPQPCQLATQTKTNFQKTNFTLWREHLRKETLPPTRSLRTLLASRSQWKRFFKERILQPSNRSWTQLANRSNFRFYRGYSFAGFRGSDSQIAVWGLIGANLAVYGLWQFVDRSFMMRNFTVSVNSVTSGRIHTLVTSAFSQVTLDHLLPNMLGLYFFGSEIAQIFGGRWLVNLYLAGAIAGSLGHVAYCAYVVPWLEGIPRSRFNAQFTPSALGASGAVNAIVLLQILLFPTRVIMLNFFIPVPAALFGVYLIGSDVWQARNEGSRTAHAGHLGGALVGLAAWINIRRRWR